MRGGSLGDGEEELMGPNVCTSNYYYTQHSGTGKGNGETENVCVYVYVYVEGRIVDRDCFLSERGAG